MSRATAVIRLPDGSLRYALYEGTGDSIWRDTYPDSRLAWDAYGANDHACGCTEGLVWADYWTTYGGGTLTRVRYCPEHEKLAPEHYDFYEHCEAVKVMVRGAPLLVGEPEDDWETEPPDGWPLQRPDSDSKSISSWRQPPWVK